MPYQNGAFVLPTDPAELGTLVSEAKSYWTQRDQRMAEDQDLFEMRTGSSEGKQSVTLNDGQVLVRKASAMVAAKPPRIRVASCYPEGDDLAQRVEDFLYWWRTEAERRFVQGVRNPLVYDEALWIFLRGWICGRLMLNPNKPEFPWDYTLIDPETVYPRLAGNTTLYICQKWRPTVADVLGEWPDAEQTLSDRKPQEQVDFAAIYTDTQLAVMVNNELIKPVEDHGYGFNPIIIGLAAGAPYRATERRQDWQKFMGTGILEAARQPIQDKQDLALMMKTLLSKEAEPPTVLYTEDEDRVVEMDMRSGGRMVFGVNDKIQALNTGPNIQNLMPLMELFQDSLSRGGLGPAVFADGNKFTSGFHEAVAAGSARDMMFPFVRGLERYYETLYDRVLQLYGQYGLTRQDQAIHYTATNQQTGRRTAWQAIQPQEIQSADLRVEVAFRDVTPQNQASLAQIGNQAAQSHLLDYDYIRDNYFEVDDPGSMDERVIGDLIKQNPQLIQMLAPLAAMMSTNPLIRQGAQMLLQQQAMQGQQPGGPGPTGGPPPPNMQPPNQQLPDEMGSGAGLPPNSPSPPGPVNAGGGPPGMPLPQVPG
jgi:hypothetical protein